MEIETIKITDIIPAEYNPRKISEEDYTKLKNSIKTFGLVDPIIVNLKNMHIVGGHQRYDVLLDESMMDDCFFKELSMIRLGEIGFVFTDTDLSIRDDAHEKALNLALNKISGDWDNPKLLEVINELDDLGLDLDLTGFDEFELIELEFIEDIEYDDNISDSDLSEDTSKKVNMVTCPHCGEKFEI
ncbi:ParB N-terminal domain-containing protein [uncultured Methanobrevibacter sp.]|uniref:ParB N-terminal domain-containing protein n=1 Tax=uncultured Methanobrevibacter sp. TaxID=253161 RepID=UPI0026172E3F|nr:ParB N-terminal domain-containing protein [uncultured Methanobrevibacter sp.]